MPTSQNIQGWAPVASTALAAIAATAAWFNVRHSRRQWLTAHRPVIVAQLVDRPERGRIELELLNTGVGAARRVRFCVVLGDQFVAGYAGPNFGAVLKSDELRVVGTQLQARSGEPRCVVTCLDNADRLHVFDTDGGHRVRRLRGDLIKATDPVAAFRSRYSSVDLDTLQQVGGAAHEKLTTGR